MSPKIKGMSYFPTGPAADLPVPWYLSWERKEAWGGLCGGDAGEVHGGRASEAETRSQKRWSYRVVWPLDRQVLNEEWLQRDSSWMKNVVYCRLCIGAGRAIYSDLTGVRWEPFAVIWSDSMESETAFKRTLGNPFLPWTAFCQKELMSTLHTIFSEALPNSFRLRSSARGVLECARFILFKVYPKRIVFPPHGCEGQFMNFWWGG